MKSLFLVLLSTVVATGALAAEPSCVARADEKKLAGAARTSFMKKCETDASASCESKASERKLAGAAKNSFTKKCVGDAVGAAKG